MLGSEKPFQILVVEDDQLDQLIIKRALIGSGIEHELTIADDHESGKAATEGNTFDCIFLDYNLPGGTGLELLKEIRGSGNLSPIIIVTSQGDEKLAVEAMKLGANDYIPKLLLSADGIAQTVRYIVNLKKQAQERLELESKLKETQNRLNTVVANAPIILFSLDTTGVFRLFEGRGLEHLGLEKDSFINAKLGGNNSPVTHEDYSRAMSGEEFTITVEWSDKFFEVYYTPIRSGNKIDGVIGIATDITIHKRAAEQLVKAKILAEETAVMKEQFLANMSHEIRTPMNGIIGLTRILLNSTLSHEQRKYLDSINTCSNNLMVIINDILDFSKIEAGKLSFETVPFSLHEAIKNSIELFQIKADEKSLQLISEIADTIPEQVLGDPTRLSQILNNLVSNAIKFTEKGDVRISTFLTSKTDDKVSLVFEVKDSGIGIPANSLNSVFESFTQASSDTTRKFGGTGLGLTIVKNLVELQNGTIQVRSKVGQGTTFSFTLDFTLPTGETTIQVTDIVEEQSISHLNILIAEDNKINQLIIRKVLEDWGATITLVDNGQEAVEKLFENDYDLILMDIQMPIMDGYTAVKTIHSTLPPAKSSTPIMAMTAHATLNEKQKCLDKGMNDYISKPFEPLELKKKIIALTKSNKPSLNQDKGISHSPPMESNTPSSSKPASVNAERPAIDRAKELAPEVKINLNYLKQIAEGNDTFIIEMIELFLNKTPEALEEMEACFQKQNWQELRALAHKIKPSYGYFGLPELQAQLAELEALSESQKDPVKIHELMKNVSLISYTAFEQLKRELLGMK